MVKIPMPYVAWRDGRPRFTPGSRERALGFKGRDLRHDDGRWFSLSEASGFAIEQQRAIQAARKSGRMPKLNAVAAMRGQSVQDLLLDFLQSGKFKRPRADGGFSDKTKRDYADKINAIVYQPVPRPARKSNMEYKLRTATLGRAPRAIEPFAMLPARAIQPGHISNDEAGGFYEYLKRVRGEAMARGCVMVLSSAYKWGRKASDWKLPHNPCTQLGIAKLKPRGEPWPVEALLAAIAFADHSAIGEPEMADAILLGLLTAQREADLLAVTSAHAVDVPGEDDEGRDVTVKKIRLVQSKRGRHIEIPFLPPLLARLEAMAHRRVEHGWHCEELIVDGHSGRGFNQNTFQQRFREFRRAVAAGRPDLGLPPCEAIRDLKFGKLRNTGLTWLRKSKADDDEFMAFSGHARSSLPQVMPHYFTPGAEEATAGAAKLWTWMQKRGIKL